MESWGVLGAGYWMSYDTKNGLPCKATAANFNPRCNTTAAATIPRTLTTKQHNTTLTTLTTATVAATATAFNMSVAL